MIRKVIYISDFSLNQYNSVRDILYNFIHHDDMVRYQQIIVKSNGMFCHPLRVENIAGYKTYSAPKMNIKSIIKSTEYKGFEKFKYLFRYAIFKLLQLPRIRYIYRDYQNDKYFKKIFDLEEPDIVIYLSISPKKNFSKICRNTPYISALYDTFIERPDIDVNEAFKIEKDAIEHSVGYFVPNFFYKGYLKHYDSTNIHSFNLPLLVNKEDVLLAYENANTTFNFTYFGQMQSFRNGDRVKEIFKALGFSLDIFTTDNRQSDDVFTYHRAVTQNELYEVVASSNYLIALDNGEPYTNYLPSKAYLYVSFTKPIIAFGNNKESALKRFLKDYPWFYYHDIDNPSLEGLKAFINQTCQSEFNNEVYSKYLEYSPQEALASITSLVKTILDKNA